MSDTSVEIPCSLEEMFDNIREVVGSYVDQNCRKVENPKGIDHRAARTIWIDDGAGIADDGAVIVRESARASFDYYGGFEYVDRQLVHAVGGYVFYLTEDFDDDDRVSSLIKDNS